MAAHCNQVWLTGHMPIRGRDWRPLGAQKGASLKCEEPRYWLRRSSKCQTVSDGEDGENGVSVSCQQWRPSGAIAKPGDRMDYTVVEVGAVR